MKTVSGIVLSSKLISLSKATSTLSSFVSSDTGASQEFGVYIRRALSSFKELKQLHKELRSPRSHRRRSRNRSETKNDNAETVGENPTRSVVVSQEASHGLVLSTPEPKRQQQESEFPNFEENGGEDVEMRGPADSVEMKKKKKKKERGNAGHSDENGGQIEKGDGGGKIGERAGEGVESREAADSEDMHNKKKKKRGNVGNSDENGGKIEKGNNGAKTGCEEEKKRKSGVLEDGGSEALEEQREKKKKRKS